MRSRIAWLARDADGAAGRMARAVELVRPLPASATKAHVLASAAALAGLAGRSDEALELGRDALALAEALGLDDVRVHVLTTIANARSELGEDPLVDYERAIEIGLAASSPETGRAVQNYGVERFLRGEIASFCTLYLQAMRLHERFGDARMTRFGRGHEVSIAMYRGDWDEAVRLADSFIAECETSPHYLEPLVRGHRAVVRLARDDMTGALADVDHALALVEDATDPQARAGPLGHCARVLMELGDARAPAAIREALEIRLRLAPEPTAITLLATLPLPDELARLLRATVTEAAEAPSRWVAGSRAVLEGRFVEAAEIYGGMPFRQAEAEARMRAVDSLRAAGRRTEADEQLVRALGFWRSVGATRYLREAEKLVAVTA